MTDLLARRRSRVPVLVAGAVAGALALAYVGLRDPHDAATPMPRCPWHWATGLDCPGCGGLRMTHELLHGHLAAAFADNAVLLLLIPVLLFLAARGAQRWARGVPTRIDRRTGWALIAAGVLWTVARNLAGW